MTKFLGMGTAGKIITLKLIQRFLDQSDTGERWDRYLPKDPTKRVIYKCEEEAT